MEVTLHAEPRVGGGSRAARRLRRAGDIPAVVYGQGIDPITVAVNRRDLEAALKTEAGLNALINLTIEGGDTHLTLARELQRHPWKGSVAHLDFIKVSMTDTVQAEVAIDFSGIPAGVTEEGGIIETVNATVILEALITEIPTSIPLDIEHLSIGDVSRIADLPALEGVTYIDDPETPLVTVSVPAAVVAEEAETELLEGEEGLEEGEEAADGEAAEEGDAEGGDEGGE